MTWLAAPFHVVAVVVAVGGLAKVYRPLAAATLVAAVLRRPDPRPLVPLVRAVGVAEVAVAVVASTIDGWAPPAALAALYLALAATAAVARRRGVPECGCFGAVGGPPGTLHVVVDVAAAAVAGVVAVRGVDVTAVPPGVAAVVYVGLVGLGAWLVVGILTALAATTRPVPVPR